MRTCSILVAAFAVLASVFDPRSTVIAESAIAAIDGEGEPLVLFASQARHAVLPGATYTVAATSPAAELQLWRAMLAFSARREPVLPSDPRAAETAFVISYGSTTPPSPGLRYVVAFGDGVVWERQR